MRWAKKFWGSEELAATGLAAAATAEAARARDDNFVCVCVALVDAIFANKARARHDIGIVRFIGGRQAIGRKLLGRLGRGNIAQEGALPGCPHALGDQTRGNHIGRCDVFAIQSLQGTGRLSPRTFNVIQQGALPTDRNALGKVVLSLLLFGGQGRCRGTSDSGCRTFRGTPQCGRRFSGSTFLNNIL
eukprot:scaffold2987_cov170-Amphora_coffeaeformis.AAC.15